MTTEKSALEEWIFSRAREDSPWSPAEDNCGARQSLMAVRENQHFAGLKCSKPSRIRVCNRHGATDAVYI
jgi:hypothetical protein